jgi:hypothetical protein
MTGDYVRSTVKNSSPKKTMNLQCIPLTRIELRELVCDTVTFTALPFPNTFVASDNGRDKVGKSLDTRTMTGTKLKMLMSMQWPSNLLDGYKRDRCVRG